MPQPYLSPPPQTAQLVIAYTTRVTVSPKWLAPCPRHKFRKISLKFCSTTFLSLFAAASVASQERRFFGILRAGKRKDGKWTVLQSAGTDGKDEGVRV